MIKIALPANMEKTTTLHLAKSGRPITFFPDQDLGTIDGEGENIGDVIRLRSFDIPAEVSDSCDVGLVGLDWVKERELELGLGLKELDYWDYGRELLSSAPRLEVIIKDEDPTNKIKSLRPGIVLGEQELLIKKYLEEQGWKGKVAIMGKDGVPGTPKELRKYCEGNGLLGIRIVHGKIGALVRLGAGYGVMVSETDKTLRKYELKVLDKIMDTPVTLIADLEAIQGIRTGPEIMRLHRGLSEAYYRHLNPEAEVRRRNTETQIFSFASRER